MLSGSASGQQGLQSAVTRSNNMNSKVNKRVGQLPENLRLNGRTPSGKPRLFVCQICTRAFARQEHLTRHERSHTKEKPYSCGICNRNFSRRDLLLRHANKIHGGSFGDSIIKHNKDSGSKVAKRASTGTPASATAESGSESGSRAGRRSSQCAHPPTVKRRASYSAQSGKYVAPVQNRDTHKLDRVRFSTPELLPIDLLESGEETISQDLKSGADDFSLDGGEPLKVPQAQDAPMASPNDFNLLDSVNWINDYNNEPLHTSEAGTGTGTGTARTRTETTNSANISPDSNNGNFNLQAAIARPSNSMNIRSSWSINEADGGLQMKSLFSTVSPSSSSKDNSVLPNSSTANSNSWLRPPSELLTNNDVRRSPSFNVSGACSEETGNPPLENQEQDLDLLQSCTPYPQSILPQLAETEEKQSLLEPLLDRFDATAGTLADVVADTIPENDYTAYGMDYLTLSHITRAIPPSNENSNPDLPSSKIFTPELRQMCMDASAYYGDYYSESDGVRTSKELILPNCRELNLYVSYFREFFNSHHPVIHPDFFNLDLTSLKNYVHEGFEADDENDRNLQFSNVACLPLFVATVGSLFKPEPNAKTTTLYEISRRVLHVFLERRKEQHHPNQKERSAYRSGQHVWLIQSLSLSIIYTLFADSMGKVDSEMIKRQVSAVCSIIKNNFLTAISYDSVSGAASGPGGPSNFKQQETGSSEINDFFSYVMFESKIRCTLIAYKFCQFLRIFYNVEAKLFLSEQDIEPICIPDDEITWNRASLFLPHEPMKKSNVTSFRKFYDSFTFNHSGMKPIPESLASIMLYYEFNISTHSTFHVFLTRIDIKKLEKNLSQIQSQLNLDDINNLKSNYISTLKSDSIVLRNCLMTMNFLLRVDRNFGSKVWHGKMKDLFDSFINPKTMNILSKGSYSLLTDFLVALNSSIKNIANVFKLDDSKTKIHLNKRIMSMFNLQAYHNDFLMLLKFIMDFEHKPNFKLLCIFKELKRLADRLLIPFLSQKYPLDFAQFEDVSTVNNLIQQNVNSLPDSSIRYSSINVEELEKLINNVLVYSFNDSSFLKMSGQLNNEFTFNKDHPTYDPFDLSTTEFIMPLESTSKSHDFEMESAQTQQNFTSSEAQTVERTSFDGKMESTFPHSPVELMSTAPNKESSDKMINSSDFKQGFAERYRLSEKYVVIAKCFFTFVRESYVNCHILDRITNDFQQLKYCLDEERDRSLALVPTRSEETHDNKNFSHPAFDSTVSPFNHIENLHNDTSSDVFDIQMSSRV